MRKGPATGGLGHGRPQAGPRGGGQLPLREMLKTFCVGKNRRFIADGNHGMQMACSMGVSIRDGGRPPDFGEGDALTNVPTFDPK